MGHALPPVLSLIIAATILAGANFRNVQACNVSEGDGEEARLCSSDAVAPSEGSPYLAVIITARLGNKDSLKTTVSSITGVADAVIHIPHAKRRRKRILSALAAVEGKLLQHDIVWSRSLSAVHNAALDVAAAAGARWALLMDDSEELRVEPEGLNPTDLPNLKDLLRASQHSVIHCYDEHPCTKPRFIKLPTQGTFAGPTHELFIMANDSPPSPDQLLDQVNFYKHDYADLTALLEQDKQLLLDFISKGGSANPRWQFFLGRTYKELEEHAKAAAAFEAAAAAFASGEMAAWACFEAALSYRAADATSQAVDMLKLALVKDPGMPEVPWLLSVITYYSSRYTEAVNWATIAVAVGCFKGICSSRDRQGYRDAAAWFENPYDILYFSYSALGDTVAAAEADKNIEEARGLRIIPPDDPVLGIYQSSGYELSWAQLQIDAEARIKQQQQLRHQKAKPRVAVAFVTSADRPHFFHRCYHSFRLHCLDCDDMVDAWYAIDDFSRPENLALMLKTTGHAVVKWLDKPWDRRGLPGSLNVAREAAQDADYLIILRDDWLFIKEGDFITAAIEVMRSDPTIGHVLFDVACSQQMDLEGEEERVELSNVTGATPKGQSFVVYPHPAGVDEKDEKVGGSGPMDAVSLSHGPHFSLSPGVTRVSALEAVGPFEEDEFKGMDMEQVEHAYAKNWAEKGYKTVLLPPGVHAIRLVAGK